MKRFPIAAVIVLAGGLVAHAAEPGRSFRLAPEPGSTWTLEATTGLGGSTTVLGTKVDVSMQERLLATLVVEKVNPEGAAVVRIQVDRLQGIERAGDKIPVEYDSADPVRPASDAETWLAFEKRAASIVGRRWRLVLRPDGAITDVSAETDGAAVDSLDHPLLVTSAEVLWLGLAGRDAVRLPDHPVAVGATWLHQPAEVPAKADEPTREPVYESRYAAREQGGARTVDVVTTRRLPPKKTFSLKPDVPVEVDGRLVFDAATGDVVEGAWEGEWRSHTSAWWMLGKKMAVDMRFALRVVPAPAAVVRQAEAIRRLPPVTR